MKKTTGAVRCAGLNIRITIFLTNILCLRPLAKLFYKTSEKGMIAQTIQDHPKLQPRTVRSVLAIFSFTDCLWVWFLFYLAMMGRCSRLSAQLPFVTQLSLSDVLLLILLLQWHLLRSPLTLLGLVVVSTAMGGAAL